MTDPRTRIVRAAFAVLRERGYAATNTNEIAARAKVSKRELYVEFGSKQGIFEACIASRAATMRAPLDDVVFDDRASFAAVLCGFGEVFLREIYHPDVIAMHRLVIAAAEESPELARMFDETARKPVRLAVAKIMQRARAANLVAGTPTALAEDLFAQLLSEQMTVVLGVAPPPGEKAVASKARDAVAAFFKLHGD
jgi:AcrR family transcriptional regulator